jgi:uncharacterized lipoprotein YmbA
MILLCACATGRPDRFYVLTAQPPEPTATRAEVKSQVVLKVTLPILVDRAQMVFDASGGGVMLLEHERWAAPLGDLVSQTLARDLERRRADIMVADRRFDRAGVPSIKIVVDVVQMSLRKSGRASIETHWRIIDPRTGADQVGSDVFSASAGQDGYGAVAQALSDCLGLLADRLLMQIPGA